MTDKLLQYEKKKHDLCEEVKQCSEKKLGTLVLKKDSSNLFRHRKKDIAEKKIDVRSFNRILSIDKDKWIANVEGMITYEDLVRETLKQGCLPTVVPELKSITVGGALAGCGIESSSFRYGLVHETIKEIEVLLGKGETVVCCPTNEHSDLFYAFPNTFGSFGYALRVKVQLIPAKGFVKLKHQCFTNSSAYFHEFDRLCFENRLKGSIDYMDGVIFGKNEMYITTAEFVDRAPYTSNYRYRHIYYRSIQKREEDYLSTIDYIWRWDPDWFWCSKVFFMQHPLMRLLFGKWMLKSVVYSKIMHFIHRHPFLGALYEKFVGKKESIIQDVLIPINKAHSFLEFFNREIGIKPIWICPTYPYAKNAHFQFCPLNPENLYVDFGFWDTLTTEKTEGYYNRKIEEKVKDFGGFKSLYSSSYYTEKEFWNLYDHSAYLKMKKKYDPSFIYKDFYAKCVKR